MASTRRGHPASTSYKISTRDQIVKKAIEGSTEHIQELRRTIEPNEFTPELVEGVLKHLNPDSIPEEVENRTAAQDHPEARRADACLNLLAHLAEDALQTCPSSTRESIIPLFISSLENMLAWINFFLDFLLPVGPLVVGPDFPYSLHAEFLVSLSNHEKVTEAYLSSKLFLQTFFKIFIGKDKRTGRFYAAWDPRPEDRGDDAILLLCRRLLDIPSGREIIAEELQTLDMGFDLASAAVQRAVRLTNAVSEPASPKSLARYAARLLGIINVFGAPTTDPNSQALRLCLQHIRPISRLTKMCDKLSHALAPSAGPNELNALQFTCKALVSTVCLLGPLTAHNVGAFVKMDGLTMVARLAIHLNSVDEAKSDATMHCLITLAQYIMWPCVLRSLFGGNRNSLDQSVKTITRIPRLKDRWDAFWSKAEKARVTYDKILENDPFTLCDCPNCPNETRRFSEGNPRQCSGCRTAVYCAPFCQALDWRIGFHKLECSAAREFYVAQQESGTWYSHRSRALHVKMVEQRCEESYTEIYEAAIAKNGLTVNAFFPTFNFCDPESTSDDLLIFKAEGGLEPLVYQRRGQALGPQEDFRGSRLLWFMKTYRDNMKGTSMRLAEGAFRYGPEENLYLLVLLKEVDGKFRAVASVPRICVRDAEEECRHGSA